MVKLETKCRSHTGGSFVVRTFKFLYKVTGLAVHFSKLLALVGMKTCPWNEFPETLLCYVNKPVHNKVSWVPFTIGPCFSVRGQERRTIINQSYCFATIIPCFC